MTTHEEKMIAVFRQCAKQCESVEAVCRRHGVTVNAFYRWRREYLDRLRRIEKAHALRAL